MKLLWMMLFDCIYWLLILCCITQLRVLCICKIVLASNCLCTIVLDPINSPSSQCRAMHVLRKINISVLNSVIVCSNINF